MYGVVGAKADGTINLQSTLSASSANSPFPTVSPHHPITCVTELWFEEDNTFRCEHASAPSDDVRTQFCVDHSVALLLIELARAL